jgi:hypothetical protein
LAKTDHPNMINRSSVPRQRSRLSSGPIGVMAGLLLTANVCLATGAVPDPPDAHDITALLREVEHQVSAGHAISPEEDCGMETWKLVVLLQFAAPESQSIRAALEAFVTRMRARANVEKSEGKPAASSDLTAFADQASRLLENPARAPAPAPGKTTAPDVLRLDGQPPPASLAESRVATSALANEASPGRFEPDAATPTQGIVTIAPPPIDMVTGAAISDDPPASTPPPLLSRMAMWPRDLRK